MSDNLNRVPVLDGGISTQASHVRFPSQVEDASNAYFSVLDGAVKRPGSKVAGVIYDFDHVEARMHIIDRSDLERFVVTYGTTKTGGFRVRVFNIDQKALPTISEHTVVGSGGGAYFAGIASLRDPDGNDVVRMITLGDATFILRRDVKPAAGSVPTYSISDTFRDFDILESFLAAPDAYYKAEQDAASGANAGFYHYLISAVGDNGFAQFIGRTDFPDAWASPNAGWDNDNRNPMGFKIRFQRQAKAIAAASLVAGTLTSVGDFADYVFDANDEIDLDGAFFTIASRIDDDSITITAPPADGLKVVTGISREFNVTNIDFFNDPVATMFDVALRLQSALQGAGADDALVFWDEDAAPRGRLIITSPWRGAGSEVLSIDNPSAGHPINFGFSGGGPLRFSEGSVVAGSGSPTTSTLPLGDRWEAVAASGDADGTLDPDTMPQRMDYDPVTGTFTIGNVEWSDRLNGDAGTNPLPALLKNREKIADIAFHRNRLVFAGAQHMAMSSATDLFQFYLDDPENVVDSDRIELTITSGDPQKVSRIQYLVPFRDSILVFADSGEQFEMSSPDVLTQDSVAIAPSTTKHMTESVRPAPLGTSTVYFASQKLHAGVIYEYLFDDLRVASVAQDITAHTFGLMPSSLRKIIAAPDHNMIVVVPEDCGVLYPYNFRFDGARRVQSAWSKWTYGGAEIADNPNGILGGEDVVSVANGSGGYAFPHDIARLRDDLVFLLVPPNPTGDKDYEDLALIETQRLVVDVTVPDAQWCGVREVACDALNLPGSAFPLNGSPRLGSGPSTAPGSLGSVSGPSASGPSSSSDSSSSSSSSSSADQGDSVGSVESEDSSSSSSESSSSSSSSSSAGGEATGEPDSDSSSSSSGSSSSSSSPSSSSSSSSSRSSPSGAAGLAAASSSGSSSSSSSVSSSSDSDSSSSSGSSSSSSSSSASAGSASSVSARNVPAGSGPAGSESMSSVSVPGPACSVCDVAFGNTQTGGTRYKVNKYLADGTKGTQNFDSPPSMNHNEVWVDDDRAHVYFIDESGVDPVVKKVCDDVTVWTNNLTNWDVAGSLKIDVNGNLYVAGRPSGGGSNMRKINSATGVTIWSKEPVAGLPSAAFNGHDIAILSDTEIYVGGEWKSGTPTNINWYKVNELGILQSSGEDLPGGETSFNVRDIKFMTTGERMVFGETPIATATILKDGAAFGDNGAFTDFGLAMSIRWSDNSVYVVSSDTTAFAAQVRKFNSAGAVQWTRSITNFLGWCISVDDNGDAYVGGSTPTTNANRLLDGATGADKAGWPDTTGVGGGGVNAWRDQFHNRGGGT